MYMFYRDKNVLVTGGSGFIGSHLVDALLQAGAHVRVSVHRRLVAVGRGIVEEVAADLTRYEDCLRVMHDMDLVFHAAGAVGAAGVVPSNQLIMINDNLLLAGNILRACWESGVKRLLLYGSSTGYPDLHHPVCEDEMWDGPPHNAYFGYGWMRRYMEKLAEFVASRSELKIALIRPTAVYGERDDSHHVIPSLIRRALAKEDPFVIWGDGSEVRDFLHVSDLARASLLMLERYSTCDPVNIGYGKTSTIRQVVEMILHQSGHIGCKVEYDTSKPSTIPYRAVSVEKAKKLLGFTPQVELDEGLKRMVASYRAQLQ